MQGQRNAYETATQRVTEALSCPSQAVAAETYAQHTNRAQAIYSALYAAKYVRPTGDPLVSVRESFVRGELTLGAFEIAVEAILRSSRDTGGAMR